MEKKKGNKTANKDIISTTKEMNEKDKNTKVQLIA